MCTIINCLCKQRSETNHELWRPQLLYRLFKNYHYLPIELWLKINDHLKQAFQTRVLKIESLILFRKITPYYYFSHHVGMHIFGFINQQENVFFPKLNWELGYTENELEFMTLECKWSCTRRDLFIFHV